MKTEVELLIKNIGNPNLINQVTIDWNYAIKQDHMTLIVSYQGYLDVMRHFEVVDGMVDFKDKTLDQIYAEMLIDLGRQILTEIVGIYDRN